MGSLFEDGKEDGALRTIGEVSSALGIKTHVLRYWEQQFPMLDPLKRSGGRRYYRTKDVELVQEIDRLVNREGYTLRGAAAALKESRPEESSPDTAEPLPAARQAPPTGARQPLAAPDTLARLKAIRASLAEALEA